MPAQLDMFEIQATTKPYPIGYSYETFEQKQSRHRSALLYWLQVTRIHAKPGELPIEKNSSNGAWIDSWLIPNTRAGILDELGGMASVW
jgi:hypothetical protein